MTKSFGKVFRAIRVERGLSRQYLARDIMSLAGLGKFERDQSAISINKLVLLLNRMNVSVTEFLDRVNSYSGSQSVDLYNRLTKLIMEKDVPGLTDLWRKETVAILDKNDHHDQHLLNSIAIECGIAIAKDTKPIPSHVTIAVTYLREISNWMQFDIRLADVVVTFVDNSSLSWFADSLFKKVYDTRKLADNGFRTGELGLNILAIFLDRGMLDDALTTIHRLDNSSLPNERVTFAFRFESLKSVYQYQTGNIKSSTDTFQLISNTMIWLGLTKDLKFLINQRDALTQTKSDL